MREVIVIGAVLLALLVLAFAGRDLGVNRENASGWEMVLFCLLLVGIVASKRKATEDEEF